MLNNIKKLISILIYYILNFIGFFIKKNEDYIVIGSWQGKNYTDNPRYLMEYMLENTDNYIFVWMGKDWIKEQLPNNSRVKFCKINSLKSIYYVLKSKYAIFSQGTSDIFKINIYKNMVTIFLDHGIPVKKWALDDQRFEAGLIGENNLITNLYKKLTKSEIQYDYFISASTLNDQCIFSALANLGPTREKVLKSGTPRNDILFNKDQKIIRELKEKYASLLGFDTEKKVILYAPTFRRTNSKIEVFCDRVTNEKEKLKDILKKHNAILIEKNHFATFNQKNINGLKEDCLFKIDNSNNQYINIQEVLLFTDILISDYSGVFLDYAILDRPMIHFAFDYEYYRDIDSGLYYDIEDFSGGAITKTFDDTCKEIELILSGKDNYVDKRHYVKNKYLEYEKGKASEMIVQTIFKHNLK